MIEDFEKENNYYVYILLNNLKPGKYSYEGLDRSFLYEPFYVGKGRNNRARDHQYSKDKFNHKKQKIVDSIKLSNSKIYYDIYSEGLSSDSSFVEESSLIDIIGRIDKNNGPLTNMNKGGNGPVSRDDFSRDKLSFENRGDGNPNSKLSKKQIIGILNLLANGWLPIHVEKLFNLRQKYIDEFKSGKTWKYLKNDYPELFEKIKKFRRVKFSLNPRQIKQILYLKKSKKISADKISAELNLPYATVRRLIYCFDKIPYIIKLKECNLL